MTASCIFCRIAAGEIPAEVIETTEDTFAFLDVQPLADGHVLVIPRRHVPRVEALEPREAEALFRTVAGLTGPLQKAMAADGTTIGINDGEVTGQTVPHLHIHIVPRYRGDGIGSVHSLFPAGSRRPLTEIGRSIRQAVSSSS